MPKSGDPLNAHVRPADSVEALAQLQVLMEARDRAESEVEVAETTQALRKAVVDSWPLIRSVPREGENAFLQAVIADTRDALQQKARATATQLSLTETEQMVVTVKISALAELDKVDPNTYVREVTFTKAWQELFREQDFEVDRVFDKGNEMTRGDFLRVVEHAAQSDDVLRGQFITEILRVLDPDTKSFSLHNTRTLADHWKAATDGGIRMSAWLSGAVQAAAEPQYQVAGAQLTRMTTSDTALAAAL